MPFAPLLPRSYWTGVATPRVPTAARMRVTPPRMFDSTSAVMSWRWVLYESGAHGPLQLVPPSYDKKSPFFVPTTTLLESFGSTAILPTASYCANWPAGSVYDGEKTVEPSTFHVAPPSVDLRLH